MYWTEEAIALRLDQMVAARKKPRYDEVEEQPVNRDWMLVATEDSGEPVTCAKIMRVVAKVCGIKVMEVASIRRAHRLSRARQIYYYAARNLTGSSFPKIAAVCGGRDHSTIMYGIQRVTDNPGAFEPELGLVMRFFENQTEKAV